jgi:hypothetical protein
MDPATIGLLISLAPTVLDLLFGRGHHIKKEELIQNLKDMYGYGLEGYGLYGQGYRYPHVEGYYDEPIETGMIQKGPRAGQELKRYPPKVDDRWIATYLLNKRLAAKNKWREYATKALREASKQYLADLKAKSPDAYADASKKYQKEVLEPLKKSGKEEDLERYEKIMRNKELREARKGLLPLALRAEEARKRYEELQNLSDAELLQQYYAGLKPKKKKKKSKLVELTELAKK